MLKIHFLNVGHGDCCIVEFLDNSRKAMIDINRTEEMDNDSVKEIFESLSNNQMAYSSYLLGGISAKALLESAGYNITLQDPLSYLSDNGIYSIFRFISTHPHMDHLTGVNQLKTRYSISNFWVVRNNYSQDMSKLSDSQKQDWNIYKKYRDTTNDKEDDITIIHPEEGSQREFYTEDGISILAPNSNLKKIGENNANELSYVILIKHKGRKILLPGDAEKNTWEHLVEQYPNELKNIDILKAAHHGRDSGYYQPAVKLMSPKVTIVSVGKKPSTDATNKYKQYSENVWSTRWKGNIVFAIDDSGNIEYQTQYDR